MVTYTPNKKNIKNRPKIDKVQKIYKIQKLKYKINTKNLIKKQKSTKI